MLTPFPSVCIVGFGAFGRLAARHLSPYARVSIFDPSADAITEAARRGLGIIHDPRDLARADIVILAVPVPALDDCLRGIAPHLQPGQIVVDTCSIKEQPARLMRQHLPGGVDILASHPMFGPQSARGGIAGLQVVLCPIRGRGWRRLAAFLRHCLHLQVIVTTPEDHDRQAAMTQGLTHLLARAFATLGETPRIRTRSFTLMTEAMALVAGDAPELFEAVTRGNRHVTALCENLSGALAALTAPAPGDPGTGDG